jgi:hypothetical protein
MANDPTRAPLPYATPTASAARGRARRIYYCIGLPMVGFGLASLGNDALFRGAIAAVGAFLVAMALPVQE